MEKMKQQQNDLSRMNLTDEMFEKNGYVRVFHRLMKQLPFHNIFVENTKNNDWKITVEEVVGRNWEGVIKETIGLCTVNNVAAFKTVLPYLICGVMLDEFKI